MTDAHTHIDRGDARSLVCEPADEGALFAGMHPWMFLETPPPGLLAEGLERLRARLSENPSLGVGEIGLDRFKVREIPSAMREAFAAQLDLAAEFARPVVLHGTKCWGQVVEACRPYAGKIPSFLFHGFSRSGGLIPEIARMNGFISVSPAVLNDHAVNYRELVKSIPLDRLLVESDATAADAAETPDAATVAAKVAELRGISPAALASVIDSNADRLICLWVQ